MKNWLLDNKGVNRVFQYLIAALLCVLILCFVLQLWRADLRVPLQYTGDALQHAMFIRGIIDNGWYWQNLAIGAPGGLLMYDFPAVDNAAAIVIWLISIFSRDTILVLNIFYLLTFPLVTLSSLYVFRKLKLSFVAALLCSLLYSFLPYHFMRNESHLFLSAYYVVPLIVLVLLWVIAGELSELRSKRFIVVAIICVLVGSSGIYYPFFSCFLLLVAGVSGSLKSNELRPLRVAFILIGVISITVALNLSPTLIHLYKQGDPGVVQRGPGETESYGLKLSQLVLPITGHRISLFDEIKRTHNAQTLFTENDTASLGLLGAIGFLGLIGQLISRKDIISSRIPGLVRDLSILNIFAVLLATIGGFGLLFALLVSTGVRSYTRMSIFIAYFSLLLIGLGVERICQRLRSQVFIYSVAAALLFVFVLDQTTSAYVPDYNGIKAEFQNDKKFVSAVEATVPPGSMIFQLPYVPFPEHPKVNQMVDYDHLRAYLHSKTLRWSYGAMKNRESDLWQQRVASLPLEEFVQAIAFVGFSGIYLDRNGYEDGGAAKQSELSSLLGVQPRISENGRLVFFDLADYTRSLRERYPESEWQIRRDLSAHPLLLEWSGGFSGLETSPEKTWRWCSSEGELRFENNSQHSRKIHVEMSLASGFEQYDDLTITGPSLSEQLKTNATPTFFSKTITVPPGESMIKFSSAAKRIEAPGDPRVLVFRIENFKLKAAK